MAVASPCGSSRVLTGQDSDILPGLKSEEYVTQVALKTEKAASHLRWIRAERIGHPDSEALKAEQEAYQMQFAAALEKLTEEQEA